MSSILEHRTVHVLSTVTLVSICIIRHGPRQCHTVLYALLSAIFHAFIFLFFLLGEIVVVHVKLKGYLIHGQSNESIVRSQTVTSVSHMHRNTKT